MTKKTHELLGQILTLQKKKVYSKANPEYYHQPYYKLEILTPNKRIQDLYVFANLLKNPTIWPTLKPAKCLNKLYTFYYQKGRMGACLLVDWKAKLDNEPSLSWKEVKDD